MTEETTQKPSQYPATVEELTKELQRIEQESKEGWAKAGEMTELADAVTRTAELRHAELLAEIEKTQDLEAKCEMFKNITALAHGENRRLLGVLDRYRAIDDEVVSRAVAERAASLSERLAEAEDNFRRAEDGRVAAVEQVEVLEAHLADATAAISRQAAELDGLRDDLRRENEERFAAVKVANDYQAEAFCLSLETNAVKNRLQAIHREARRWKRHAKAFRIEAALEHCSAVRNRKSAEYHEKEADFQWRLGNRNSERSGSVIRGNHGTIARQGEELQALRAEVQRKRRNEDRLETRVAHVESCFHRAMRIMRNRIDRLETDLTLVEESLQAAENAALLRDATADDEKTDVFATVDHARETEELETVRKQLGEWQKECAKLERRNADTRLELRVAKDGLEKLEREHSRALSRCNVLATERDNAIATVAELEATGQELLAEHDAMVAELDQRLAQVEQLRSVVDDLTVLASANASEVTAVLVDHVAHTSVSQPVRGLDQATESGPSVRVSTLRGRGYVGPRNTRKRAVSSDVSAVGSVGTKGRTCAFRSRVKPIQAVTEWCKKTDCQNYAIGATDLKPEPMTSGWIDRGLDTLSRWTERLAKAARRSGGNS